MNKPLHLEAPAFRRSRERLFSRLLAYGVIFIFMIMGCAVLAVLDGCKGAQTTIGATVRVDANTCQETRAAQPVTPAAAGQVSVGAPKPVGSASAPLEMISLDCPRIGAEGTITVQFPRKEWAMITGRSKYLPDSGAEDPGK